MTTAYKTYAKNFGFSMFLYTVAVFGSVYYLNSYEVKSWLKFFVALTPLIPAYMAFRSILTFSRSWDELQMKKNMEAVLISFLLTGFGFFAYGFLEGVGFPVLHTSFIFPIMIAFWGLAQVYTAWKYK